MQEAFTITNVDGKKGFTDLSVRETTTRVKLLGWGVL